MGAMMKKRCMWLLALCAGVVESIPPDDELQTPSQSLIFTADDQTPVLFLGSDQSDIFGSHGRISLDESEYEIHPWQSPLRQSPPPRLDFSEDIGGETDTDETSSDGTEGEEDRSQALDESDAEWRILTQVARSSTPQRNALRADSLEGFLTQIPFGTQTPQPSAPQTPVSRQHTPSVTSVDQGDFTRYVRDGRLPSESFSVSFDQEGFDPEADGEDEDGEPVVKRPTRMGAVSEEGAMGPQPSTQETPLTQE